MDTMGAFHRHISQNQLHNYSDGDIGWIFGIYAFLSHAYGLVVDPLVNKYNARWVRLSNTDLMPVPAFLLRVLLLSVEPLEVSFIQLYFRLSFHMRGGQSRHGFGLHIGLPLLDFLLVGSKTSPFTSQCKRQPRFHDPQKATICCFYFSGLRDRVRTIHPFNICSSYATYMGFNDAFGSQLQHQFYLWPHNSKFLLKQGWTLQYHDSHNKSNGYFCPRYMAPRGKYQAWHSGFRFTVWVCKWFRNQPSSSVHWATVSDGRLWAVLRHM